LIFSLLFGCVFNSTIILPGHGSYRDFLTADIFAVNMGGSAQGAAIGPAVDLSTGLIDRFRSRPMSRTRAMALAGRILLGHPGPYAARL
jgi:ABC-2 type transport system permease protein